MPSDADHQDFKVGLKASYYQNDSAQASSATVPLVFRTSGSNIRSSSDRDDQASLNSTDRNSILYNDLLEEVRKPNMSPVEGDTLPPSLRVASYMRPSPAHVRSASIVTSNESNAPVKSASQRKNEGVPRKGSKRSPQSNTRDSLERKSSKQTGRQKTGNQQAGLMLPTSTYQPMQSPNRATVDSSIYKAYRPSTTSRKPSTAKNKGNNSVSRKPLVAAGMVVGAAGGAVAAYTATHADESFLGASATPHRLDEGTAGVISPPTDYGGQTSFSYPESPVLDSPSLPRDLNAPASPQVVSPFEDQFSPGGFDNSTPGSPHDSPLEIQNSPIGSFMPGDDAFINNRNSLDGADDINDPNGTRDFERNDPQGPLGASTPSTSFGGSEFFPEEDEYPKDDALNTFPPPDDSNMSRGLGLSSDDAPRSPRDSLESETRGDVLSDAGLDYTDEKGASDEPPKQKPLWKRPIVLIIAGVVALLIIIAVVVGVVFAVKGKGKSGNDTSNSNSNNVNNTPDTSTTQATPVLGGFKNQDPALINDAFVMSGTSMNTVTVGGSSRKRQTSNGISNSNFFNFYQHSTGEIRMASWLNSNFRPSALVVTDGHQGTPIAAYSRTDKVQISIFYFNKDKILQEVRSQDGVNWQPGTIGKLGLTSDAPSDLSVEYVGQCGQSGLAWLVFHTGVNDQTKLVYWNEATDTWTATGGFPNVKQGAGFQGQSDGDAWRFYYVSSQNSQLSQMVCPECCENPKAPTWKPGINGPPVTSATGGITVVTAGLPRIIYYQDADGTVRELNNTGKYPQESYMMNVAPSRRGNLGVPAPNNTPTGPVGSAVGKVLPDSKMGVAAGFRGSNAQLWLFTQINETGISLTIRSVDVVGQWTSPISIPVGR